MSQIFTKNLTWFYNNTNSERMSHNGPNLPHIQHSKANWPPSFWHGNVDHSFRSVQKLKAIPEHFLTLKVSLLVILSLKGLLYEDLANFLCKLP